MKKIVFVMALFIAFCVWLAADELAVTLEFTGVKINKDTKKINELLQKRHRREASGGDKIDKIAT